MNTKTKTLVECAIMVALATVLSLIKVFKMPWGGSVTLLSMLPICFASVRHGVKWGFGTAFVYSCIQLVLGITMDGLLGWGLTGGMLVACILLDYIIAFTVLGVSGIFAGKGTAGVIGGTALAIALRLLSHVLSGVYVFKSIGLLWDAIQIDNPWLYSLGYNGAFMLPELILTLAGAAIVYKAMKKRNIG